MVMWGRSVNVTTLFMGRLRPSKQLTNTKVHILSPVTLLESAEGETKVSGPTGYRTSDLWLSSQTLRIMVYAKFQYSLNALFCEPTDIREYKRKLYMYRVPEFRTMLTFINYEPLKRSTDLAYDFEFVANDAPMHAKFQ